MITSTEVQELYAAGNKEIVDNMLSQLDRIKADQEMIVDTRNRMMNGKASGEQMFMAISSASTNMVIFRELFEKHIRMYITVKKVDRRAEQLESRLDSILKRKPAYPETKIIPSGKILSFPGKVRATNIGRGDKAGLVIEIF